MPCPSYDPPVPGLCRRNGDENTSAGLVRLGLDVPTAQKEVIVVVSFGIGPEESGLPDGLVGW